MQQNWWQLGATICLSFSLLVMLPELAVAQQQQSSSTPSLPTSELDETARRQLEEAQQLLSDSQQAIALLEEISVPEDDLFYETVQFIILETKADLYANCWHRELSIPRRAKAVR